MLNTHQFLGAARAIVANDPTRVVTPRMALDLLGQAGRRTDAFHQAAAMIDRAEASARPGASPVNVAESALREWKRAHVRQCMFDALLWRRDHPFADAGEGDSRQLDDIEANLREGIRLHAMDDGDPPYGPEDVTAARASIDAELAQAVGTPPAASQEPSEGESK